MLKTLFSAATPATDWSDDRPSLIDRLRSLMTSGSSTQKEDEIGAFIETHGGVLTDDLERQISQRFGHMAGR
jgi:hypothetical protein